MSYYLYQLKFDSPVHFGDAAEGGKLEQISTDFAADTLFSAICNELAEQGMEEKIDELVELARDGKFRLSDLFPYQYSGSGKTCWFFLPRPFYYMDAKKPAPVTSMAAARKLSAIRKLNKKQPYIRISELKDFLKALKAGQFYEQKALLELGEPDMVERVNCRTGEEPLPYYLNRFTFAENTGLYGIADIPDDMVEYFQDVLTSLGMSGIGGKRSSGYGKFHLEDDMLELDDIYIDTEELMNMLNANKTSVSMAISIVHPDKVDMDIVSKGQYQLKKRSGFTGGIKRSSIYMLAAGSCLPEPIDGDVVDIARDDKAFDHPVWRYGKGMFIGLNL